MTLSVIIVNYNVKYFLEQCLHSVQKAAAGLAAEIVVVDNHSTDGSLPYLRPRFPQVKFLAAETNGGFAKACNRGLAEASGDYVLFLNPDTLVAEDSFQKCIAFFEANPGCGALGVKMIDGGGTFLKESKRAFPSPLTSLFKLSGLAWLFPASTLFSRYHLGHLHKDENHEVDVLAGAYFMARAAVLQKVGSFDEAFFMYGEDVDLSYRIQKAGYANCYFAGTTIIHFKGESTKRGSLNYVRMFYRAMSIFVKKHYGGARAGVFLASIRTAIWLRALLAVLTKLIRWMGLPVIDALIILFSFWAVKELWTSFVRPGIVYPNRLLLVAFPVFSLLFLAAAYYAGLYDRHYRRGSVLRSTAVATVTLLAVYALLPEHYRFSRGIVVFGAATAFLLLSLERLLLIKAGLLLEVVVPSSKPQLVIAASEEEYPRLRQFLQEKGLGPRLIGRLATGSETNNSVASLDNLESTAEALHAKELLFCAATLSYKEIIGLTERFHKKLRFRFHAAGSGSVVGSDTSADSGEILSAETEFALARSSNKRLKRLIDAAAALLFLLTLPLHLALVEKPLPFMLNCVAVLFGNKTWIGYTCPRPLLPYLRPGVLAPNGRRNESERLGNTVSLLDYWYARNYEPLQDVKAIFAHHRYLGG